MKDQRLPEGDLRFVAERVDSLWGDLRGGRVFLAGGTGFFGRWMLEGLLQANDAFGLDAEVTILGRDPGKLPAHLARRADVTFLQGDVRDFDFPQGRFTHVVNLAMDSTLPATDANADAIVDTLVNGTRRLLRFTAACGAQKFLLASSGAVYGAQPEGLERTPETHAGGPVLTEPLAPYAEGKRVAETLTLRATGFDATVVRAFAFVGPGLPLDAHFAIGNFLRDALAGRDVEVRGDGTAVRSYLYAADLAVWLWTILLRGEAGGIYNVGSERAIRIRDLAHLIAQESGVGVRIAPVPTALATSHRYVPCTLRARRELGLDERFSLEDAIRRTASAHQAKEPLYV